MTVKLSENNSELVPTREQIVVVLELLQTRMLWSSARTLINSTGLHVSRGWDETLAHAREDQYSDSIRLSAYKKLSIAAKWHTYVGNKHVSFFDLREQNEASRLRIIGWTRNKAVNDVQQILRDQPFDILSTPTKQSELEVYKATAPLLIAAELVEGKIYLQYFSTRAYTLREFFTIGSLPEEQAKYFNNYEEVIGIKTKLVPCFDTVVVDTLNELVEFRIDFAPGLTGDKDMSAFASVITEFNRTTTKFFGQDTVGVGLMNLYPAINPMYLDTNCGRVTTLGFVATSKDSSSNNHGQIHRTKTQDFRKDSFHVGGKLHVDKITPYAIGVTWTAKSPKSDLYLELKGSVKTIYAGKPSAVTLAEFVGCLDGFDYDFLLDQVLSRLPRKKK